MTDWGDWSPQISAGSVNELTAYNLSGVWAAQTLIADAISTMPVDVFRKVGTTREPVEPPLWVDTPNYMSSRLDYDTSRILSLLGWGNAYSVLMREGGSTDPRMPVRERYVLDPWKVSVRFEKNRPVYLFDGKPIDPANVQHIRGYALPGSALGMSVVSRARSSLLLTQSADQLGEKMFANGLNPSGVLSVPNMPPESSKTIVDRLREQFSSTYGGSVNAGKPMVLLGGTTWSSMSVTPVDAQWLETRKFQLDEIGRWFRVAPHLLGQVEKSTSWGSGIEEQNRWFLTHTLRPWIARLEDADSRLLEAGVSLRFNTNALLRADTKTRYEAHSIARLGGWASANDVLALEDLPPIPNGDIYLQPLNYIEAGTRPAPEGIPNV